LQLTVNRGQQATIALDASPSSAPGSSIAHVEWRVNGVVKGQSVSLSLVLGAASEPYQVELAVTNSDNVVDRASALISIAELAPAPVIQSVNPGGLHAAPLAQVLSIVGTDFLTGCRVSITSPNGVETMLTGTRVTVLSSVLVTANAVLDGAGDWKIHIENPDGSRSNVVTVPVGFAPPTITGVSPTSLSASRGSQRLQITGNAFQPGLTLLLRTPITSISLTGGQLETVDANSVVFNFDLAGVSGTYAFRIQNPDHQLSNEIAVDAASVDPVITTITPATVQGTGAPQSIVLAGRNFSSTSKVVLHDFGTGQVISSAVVSFGSTTQLTVTYAFPSSAGNWSAEVVNADGGRSPQVPFNVVIPPPPASPPTISSINPNPAQASSSPQRVVVAGTNFRPGSGFAIRLKEPGTGRVTAVTSFVATTATSADLSVVLGVIGTWTAQAVNPDGSVSAEAPFSVVSSPVITSVSPNTLVADREFHTMTVTGTGLDSVWAVDITKPDGSSSAAIALRNITATSLTFDLSPDQVGSWAVRVRAQNGGVSAPVFVTVKSLPPTVTGATSPLYGMGVPQLFSVFGKNFGSNASVTLRNTATGTSQSAPIVGMAQGQLLLNPTFSRASAQWTVEVTNSDGSTSNQYAFTILAPITPIITSVSQVTAKSVAQSVTVSGDGYAAILVVTFFSPNGNPVPITTFTSGIGNTFIGVAALFDVPGSWGVQVTNPDGSQSAIFKFNVAAP